jgi:hypothetical protein
MTFLYPICSKRNKQLLSGFSQSVSLAGAPNGRMNLATIGTRPHPGGGVPPDRRRAAPEAGGQGDSSPTNTFYRINLLYEYKPPNARHRHPLNQYFP